ncbi:MAG: hypothetical protein AAGD32_04630 [Planctomycetota bacterium]
MNREELQNVLKSLMLAAAVSGVAFVGVGCEESSTTDDVTDAVDEAADEAAAEGSSMLDSIKDEAAARGEEITDGAVDAMKEKAGEALESLAGPELAAKAEEMLGQAETMITEKNFAGAKEILDKLIALKDKLPEPMAARLESLTSMLDKAQGAADAAGKLGDIGGALGGGK